MHKQKKGFSLIELIVVIVILGILASISYIVYSGVQRNSRNEAKASQMTAISEALEIYHEENGEYLSCEDMAADNSGEILGINQDLFIAPGAPDGELNSFIDGCRDFDDDFYDDSFYDEEFFNEKFSDDFDFYDFDWDDFDFEDFDDDFSYDDFFDNDFSDDFSYDGAGPCSLDSDKPCYEFDLGFYEEGDDDFSDEDFINDNNLSIITTSKELIPPDEVGTYINCDEEVGQTGYIPVPGSKTYSTKSFCVMKYEASYD
jgi:prepilin-type N-terminal cleavage/methylation domain-containing protein